MTKRQFEILEKANKIISSWSEDQLDGFIPWYQDGDGEFRAEGKADAFMSVAPLHLIALRTLCGYVIPVKAVDWWYWNH